MTPTDDVLRAVAEMSSHGEWVNARDLAIALHLPKATVAVVLDVAVRDHLLDAEHDSSGIAWGRARVACRRRHNSTSVRAAAIGPIGHHLGGGGAGHVAPPWLRCADGNATPVDVRQRH